MQVTVEDLSSVKKVLHIEIPEEDVNREVDNAYKELKKTAKIRGFRPGKAPRSVLERHYRKDVDADISSRLIQESFADAIRQENLNVVGTPDLNPPDLQYKQPYHYDATVEVTPELEEIDYKGLELKKVRREVSEADIQNQLQMFQKNLSRTEAIEEDRPVTEGDFVLIHYEGFEDGAPVEDLQRTENFTMKIGSAQIAPELDDALIGKKPGDTLDVDVAFPEDYGNKTLAGRSVTFHIELEEIRKEVLPEIDDELAKNFGPFDTLDALKAEIEKNLKEGYQKRTEQELQEQIFSKLIEKRDFEVPETMVEYEIDGIIAEAERSFMYHNMTMEQLGLTKEHLAEKYRDTAVKQVKRHLILNKIIDQEKLSLEDGELEVGIAEMARSLNQPEEGIKSYYQQYPEKLQHLQYTLLEKKALDLIIKSSEIEEVEPEAAEEAVEAGEEG
ncbi:MAG: trigger factor [Thermodesulfobacteriota bacterium]